MDQLQRFIDLVNKTGDNLVVFDRQSPDKSFVILAINEYEKLIDTDSAPRDLTEGELADKINQDIAIWKNEQILDDVSEADFNWLEEDDEYEDEDEDLGEEELNYFYAEPELSFSSPEPEIFTQQLTPEEDPSPASVDTEESQSDEAEPEDADAAPEQSTRPRPDFQSLADILDTRFDRSKSNNWSIPSDRKRQAEIDADSNKYESISF